MKLPKVHLFYFTGIIFLISFPFLLQAASKYTKTPRDYEGPFYPIERQVDEDNDLIHVIGRTQAAKGDILLLYGRVIDENGNAVKNCYVEIWQTDPQGRYNDKRDSSPGERDPNFQYWGLVQTGTDGSYIFRTLVPGAYEPRPAHIHFKVWVDKKLQLTSQIYFKVPGNETGEDTLQNNDHPQQTAFLEREQEGVYKAFFQIVI